MDLKKLINESLSKSKVEEYINTALDNLEKKDFMFTYLNDFDKFALLSVMDDSPKKFNQLKRLNENEIYQKLGGTFGNKIIKVKIKPVDEQPIKHEFSKLNANKIGWLSPHIHYNDNDERYVTVTFDEFESNPEHFGGGSYKQYPIMLDNLFLYEFDDTGHFDDYMKRVEFERNEFRKNFKDFLDNW